jgi:hypothetical protein
MLLTILIIIDIVATCGFIAFLYFKGKNRYVPKITDEEYKEFLEWYKNKNDKNEIQRLKRRQQHICRK